MVLHHISLAVTNIERSIKFYCDNLQFSLGKQYFGPGIKITWLHHETAVIELLERENADLTPCQPGVWDHIAFQVDDMDAVYRRLKKAEMPDHEPRMSVFGNRICFLAGPDGERIELIEK